jgi:hypothetical protein
MAEKSRSCVRTLLPESLAAATISSSLAVFRRIASTRDRPVVHLVRDAEVAEAAEEVLLDTLDEVAAVDEVLLAKREGSVRREAHLRGGRLLDVGPPVDGRDVTPQAASSSLQ